MLAKQEEKLNHNIKSNKTSMLIACEIRML